MRGKERWRTAIEERESITGGWQRKECSEMCFSHYPQIIQHSLWVDFLDKHANERTEFHKANIMAVVCWYTSSLGGKTLNCHLCQFLWCKYSHCGWCQATNSLITSLHNSWLFNNQLSSAPPAQHFMRHPVRKTDPKRQEQYKSLDFYRP